MATKSKSTAVATAVAETAAEVSLRVLAEARTTLAELRSESVEAEEREASLNARVSNGDRTVTDSELMVAKICAGRLAALVGNAIRVLKRAERALLTDHPAIAEVLQEAASLALHMPVTAVTSKPAMPPIDLPAAYLVQSKPGHRQLYDGYVSGEVDLVLYRNATHLPANATAVATAFERASILVHVDDHGTSPAGECIVDTLHLTVPLAYEPVPVILAAPSADIDGQRLGQFVQQVTTSVEQTFQRMFGSQAGTQGVRLGNGGNGITGSQTRVVVFKAESPQPVCVSDQTDTNGLRRRVLKVEMYGWRNWRAGDLMDAKHFQDITVAAIRSLSGKPFPSIGRCESATVSNMHPDSNGHMYFTASLEMVSKHPE